MEERIKEKDNELKVHEASKPTPIKHQQTKMQLKKIKK